MARRKKPTLRRKPAVLTPGRRKTKDFNWE